MIRYALKCAASHSFDSWFRSSAAFDALQLARHVACPICGSSDIEKTLMSPNIRAGRQLGPSSGGGGPDPEPTSGPPESPPTAGALSAPGSDVEHAFAEMRKQVENNSDYVGLNFAAEARRMHDGTTPSRAIYGEANSADARQLIEDGIPVAPLPFMPSRKTN